jgi:hypothetical protein
MLLDFSRSVTRFEFVLGLGEGQEVRQTVMAQGDRLRHALPLLPQGAEVLDWWLA